MEGRFTALLAASRSPPTNAQGKFISLEQAEQLRAHSSQGQEQLHMLSLSPGTAQSPAAGSSSSLLQPSLSRGEPQKLQKPLCSFLFAGA